MSPDKLSSKESLSKPEKLIFLTLDGLLSFAREHQGEDWSAKSVFFLDVDSEVYLDPGLAADDPVWQQVHEEIVQIIKTAENEGRVTWRSGDPDKDCKALNDMLPTIGCESGMNPNFPPSVVEDMEFLEIALCTTPGIFNSNIII